MTKAKTKSGTIVFRIIYAVLTFALIGIVCCVLWHLWHYLDAFEKCQPEIPIKAAVEQMQKNKDFFIDRVDFSPNEFEEKSFVEDYYKELTNGSITYSRNGKESDEGKTVYTIKCGGKNISNIAVEAVGRDLGYGFLEYEITDVQLGKVITNTYSVTAPDNAVVYCNGKIISESYITEKGPIYDEIKFFHNLEKDFPCDVVYTIDGFIKEPVFTAVDETGNQLELKDGKFHIANIKNDLTSRTALDFAQAYSKYIVHDGTFDEAASFIYPNMKLYNDLYNFKNNWAYSHWGYEFKDITIYDTVFYTKNAVSVRVSYSHFLYGVPLAISSNGEFCSAADYTVYLAKDNGEWKVTDLIIN